MGFVLGEGIGPCYPCVYSAWRGNDLFELLPSRKFLAHSPNPQLPYMARMGKIRLPIPSSHLLRCFRLWLK